MRMQTENIQDLVKIKISSQKQEKDKFKPQFCAKDFYSEHQNQFQKIHVATQYLENKYKVIVFTLALCCLRRKNDWFAGQLLSPRKAQTPAPDFNFNLFNLFHEIGVRWPAKLSPDISLFHFLAVIKIKPIPEAALSGLFHFFTEDYKLIVLNYEPTPQEVLDYQIQNKRVLTFEENTSSWINKKYGDRDVLSFILHDLIHAEHFLGDSQKRKSQIGFYKLIKRILDNNLVDYFLLNCEFNEQFCYLISDMNSHVIHLLKTLRAIIDQHISYKVDSPWLQITQLVTSENTDALLLQGALIRLNTPLFSNSDAEVLLHFFENE